MTGVDLAPKLIDTARRLAAEEGLAISFAVGDAEALPAEDAGFAVVSSAMGLIFAPDHRAARELARVCEAGGRIGFSAWRKNAGFMPVTRRYSPPLQPGQGDSDDWGSEEYVQARLEDAFDLEFEEGDAPVTGVSGEAVWEQLLAGSGPFKTRAAGLDPEQRKRFYHEFVELLESHREDGGINVPAPYVAVLGTRR